MNDHGLTAENILRTLPVALRRDPKMLALGQAVADVLAQRQSDLKPLNIYGQMESLPEDLLDILAGDFKVDWYSCDYPPEAKARLLETERYVHQHLGTTGAIRRFIQALYPDADIKEWFSYGGEPHHFRLTLHLQEVISENALRRVVRSCRLVKRLSSWIDDIRITLPEVNGELHVGGRFAAHAALGTAERADVFDFQSTVSMGGGLAAHAALGTAERTDVFDYRSAVQMGGQAGAQAVLEGREDLTAPMAAGQMRVGGQFKAVARMGGKAAEKPDAPAGLRVQRHGCAYTILPVNTKGEG